MLSPEQMNEALALLIGSARNLPDHELPITDEAGATVATLRFHELPRRPRDMPRALRPKQRLSYRQRRQAKQEKLGRQSRSPS